MIMMKQFGKIAALCAVVAMTVVLLGQEANASAGTLDIYWQKQTTGMSAYWMLNSNGKLKDRTKDSGWSYVDTNSIGTAWRAEMLHTGLPLANGESRQILYRNTTNGKVAYWQLNSNGKLKDRTKDSGWGYVSDGTMSSDWSMQQLIDATQLYDGSDYAAGGQDRLLWFRASNGKVAYWNLNSNGVLENRTKDQGWGYVDDVQTLTNWRFVEVTESLK